MVVRLRGRMLGWPGREREREIWRKASWENVSFPEWEQGSGYCIPRCRCGR